MSSFVSHTLRQLGDMNGASDIHCLSSTLSLSSIVFIQVIRIMLSTRVTSLVVLSVMALTAFPTDARSLRSAGNVAGLRALLGDSGMPDRQMLCQYTSVELILFNLSLVELVLKLYVVASTRHRRKHHQFWGSRAGGC